MSSEVRVALQYAAAPPPRQRNGLSVPTHVAQVAGVLVGVGVCVGTEPTVIVLVHATLVALFASSVP